MTIVFHPLDDLSKQLLSARVFFQAAGIFFVDRIISDESVEVVVIGSGVFGSESAGLSGLVAEVGGRFGVRTGMGIVTVRQQVTFVELAVGAAAC